MRINMSFNLDISKGKKINLNILTFFQICSEVKFVILMIKLDRILAVLSITDPLLNKFFKQYNMNQ